MLRTHLSWLSVLFVCSTAPAALADMPGGGSSTNCDPVPECRVCSTMLDDEVLNGGGGGGGGGELSPFRQCVEDAKADGLVAACQEGIGNTPDYDEYYCPPGVDITTGCSVVPGLNTEVALVSAGALLAAAALLRARRRPGPGAQSADPRAPRS